MLSRFDPSVPAVRLDEKGRKLLARLAAAGRDPLTAIAKKVRLSRETTGYRITRLQAEGCIVGFAPILDVQRFGLLRCHVYLLFDEHHQKEHAALIAWMTAHPNTFSLLEYSDTWDLGWGFVVSNLCEFDRIVTDLSTRFSDHILEKDALLVVRSYATSTLPRSFGVVEQLPVHGTPYVPDEKDLLLLRALSVNAREPSHRLGAAAGLSGDAALMRIRRLDEANVVRGFSTIYNLATLGYSWYTYAVRFDHLDANMESRLAEFLRQHRAVIRAEKTVGSWDLLLTIVAADSAEYHAIVKEIKNTFASIIRHYESWIAYREILFSPMPAVLGGFPAKRAAAKKSVKRKF